MSNGSSFDGPGSFFSDGPVTISKATQGVDVWSNHAYLIWWVCQLILPRPQEMHPSAKTNGASSPCVRHFKGHQRSVCPGRLAVTGLGKEFTLHR